MASCFICGTSVIPQHEDEDEYERPTQSADSSPRKSRSKNPYSSRGLDQFSALLSEIEEKTRQIYSKHDQHEISLVRFVCTGDHDFKPIVVKAKPKTTDDQLDRLPKTDILLPTRKISSSSSMATKNDAMKSKDKFKSERSLWVCSWMNPKFYLITIIILILVSLVVFGRSFAIMCTSIGWYVIPIITDYSKSSSNLSKSFKNKRLNDNKLMTSEGTKSFKHH